MAKGSRTSSLEMAPYIVKKAVQEEITKKTSNILLGDLVALINKPSGLMSLLLANDGRAGGAIDLDFYWTLIRLHQVFHNLHLNKANSDKGSVQYSTPWAWALVGGGIFSTLFGIGRAAYQYLHDKYLKTDEYYIKQRDKLAPDQLANKDTMAYLELEIDKCVNAFVSRYRAPLTDDQRRTRLSRPLFAGIDLDTPDLANEIIKRLKEDDELLALLTTDDVKEAASKRSKERLKKRLLQMVALFKANEIRQKIDAIKRDKPEADQNGIIDQFDENVKQLEKDNAASLTDSERDEWERMRLTPAPAFVRAVQTISDGAFMGVVRTVYNWMQTYSYIYWLALMPVMIVAGIGVAVESLGVMIATFTIGSVLAIWNGVHWGLQKAGIIAPDKTEEEIKQEKEEQRKDHNARLHDLARETHDGAMRKILGADEWERRKKEKQETKATEVSEARQKSPHLFKERLKKVRLDDSYGIVRSFTGSKLEQGFRLFMAVTSAISTFVGFTFLSFLVIGTLNALLAPIAGALGLSGASAWLVSAATAIGDSAAGLMATAASGGVLGVIGSFFDYSKMYTEQMKTEKKVVAVLSDEYKATGRSVLEVYGTSKQSLKNNIYILERSKKQFTAEELEIIAAIKHTIEKKPHEGIRYFDKFETYTPWFSVFKKIADGVYDFLNQAQTGIFCARNLFLATGVAAAAMGGLSIVTGGSVLFAFIVAAVVLGVVVGAIGVGKAILDRRQKHREEELDSLPAQIISHKKWDKQMVAIASKYDIRGVEVSNVYKPPVNKPEMDGNSSPVNVTTLQRKSSNLNVPGVSVADMGLLSGTVSHARVLPVSPTGRHGSGLVLRSSGSIH